MIYLDNNATTRPAPEVREAMACSLEADFANPSSPYGPARKVVRAMAEARESVAALVNASPGEVVFTSGGTEANNAVLAMARSLKPDGTRVIISSVEHASVLAPAGCLAAQGLEVVYLPVNGDGNLDLDRLTESLDDRTALVSVMMANNETGIMMPLEEVCSRAAVYGIPVHSDAVQAAGKSPVSFADSGVCLLSLSMHKLHGPKGIGVLLVGDGLETEPWLTGGGQERNRRGGTENVAGIVGAGVAARLALDSFPEAPARMRRLRDRFEQRVLGRVSGVRVVGAVGPRLPNTSLLLVDGVEADAVISLLDLEGICCSSGSACAAGSHETSHVLTAMGFQPGPGALRISLSRESTAEEVDLVADRLPAIVDQLRNAGPAF